MSKIAEKITQSGQNSRREVTQDRANSDCCTYYQLSSNKGKLADCTVSVNSILQCGAFVTLVTETEAETARFVPV